MFYAKKNFGQYIKKDLLRVLIWNAILISIIVGFMMVSYWSRNWKLLVVAFIVLMWALTFCTLPEYKMVNLATNFGSICLFMLKGKII
jgi:hypothetical protein